VARFEATRKKGDPLAVYREVLRGGDVKAGRAIFFERLDVACLRCHQVKDKGGTVGPPLTKIGAEKTREYLLESILFPNKEIAKGYGQETFALTNGDIVSGRIEGETEAEVALILPDGQKKKIAKDGIRARKPGLSAMPEDIAKPLSKRDLRDLVAFLSGLK
jgi:quinoprotein glucose dehydrogenase